VRYGWHRQAAWFSIEQSQFEAFKSSIQKKFREQYWTQEHLPSKNITVECTLDATLLTLDTLKLIETFQPFGIGNPKPKFLLRDVTVQSVRPLGNSGEHLSIYLEENPEVKCVIWRCSDKAKDELVVGNIISIVVTLSKNIWNGKTSLQCTLEGIIKNEEI
jgi:single-stranded-DNA-specific exonuclease